VPRQFVKRLALGVRLTGDNSLVFLLCNRPFDFEADGRPLAFGHHGPGQPAHVEGEVVQPPQIHVGRNRAFLQGLENVFRLRLQQHPPAKRAERFILDGRFPAGPGFVPLGLDDFQ